MDAALEQEIRKRSALKDLIHSYAAVHFCSDPKNKLRRGTLQKEVADFIGITINTTFCQLMNECMEEMGYKAREIMGYYYYRNIKRNHVTRSK